MKDSSPWATCLRRRPGADLRLFCFPYAGAGAGIFRGWAEDLPDTIEVWAVHLPGRERRIADPPVPDIQGLAALAGEGLSDLLHGRFAFFGHSMGALLSFELARRLRRQHLPMPVCLAVSAFGAPHLTSVRPPSGHLRDEEFIKELHRLKGTPPGVLDNPELIELLLPVLRADFLAVETYNFAPEPPLACSIFAYGGETDPEVPLDHLKDWALHTSSSFAARSFEGDHFYLHARRNELMSVLGSDVLSL